MNMNDVFYKEDADDIYFTDGYAGFTKIHKTDFSFNKRYLNLGQIISINNYYYYYYPVIQDKQPLFLYTEYDSSNSVTNIFLQRYDLLNDSILYKTLLDTSAVAYYYPNMTAYILPDNGYIIIYAKNGVYNIARIDNAGNIIYNKVLSASIKMNENIASYYGFSSLKVPNIKCWFILELYM